MCVRVCVRAHTFCLSCFLAVGHCSSCLSVSGSAGPPFSLLSVVSPSVSAFSLSEKDYGNCALTFTRSLPEACKSLASPITSNHFLSCEPSFQLSRRSLSRGLRGIINNCLNMCCGEGMPLQSKGERCRGGTCG